MTTLPRYRGIDEILRQLDTVRARRWALRLLTGVLAVATVAVLVVVLTIFAGRTHHVDIVDIKDSTLNTYVKEQAEFFLYLSGDNGDTSPAIDITEIGTSIENYLL